MIKFGRPVTSDVETRLPRLVEALARDSRVEAMWLFGSRARREADALSDIDLAVLARRDLDASALWSAQLEWTGLAVDALGTDEVAVQAVHRLRVALRHAVFGILREAGIINTDLGRRLEDMASFRDRLVHGYLDVDASGVYDIARKELGDVEAFVATIVTRYIPDAAH